MDADAPGFDLELEPEVVLAAFGHGKRGFEVVDNAGLVARRADDEEVVDVCEHVDDALSERLAEQAAVDGVPLEPHDVEHLVREELEPGPARVLARGVLPEVVRDGPRVHHCPCQAVDGPVCPLRGLAVALGGPGPGRDAELRVERAGLDGPRPAPEERLVAVVDAALRREDGDVLEELVQLDDAEERWRWTVVVIAAAPARAGLRRHCRKARRWCPRRCAARSARGRWWGPDRSATRRRALRRRALWFQGLPAARERWVCCRRRALRAGPQL